VSASVVVVKPGPLSLIQDTGRPGLASIGVGRSGAADRGAYALANRLVGNPAGVAAIECTFGGLAIRAQGQVRVAITGAGCPATVDGDSVERDKPIDLQDGQTLTLRTPTTGLRSYLAVRGGLEVPTVLGSRSTDTLAGLGPAVLRRGDTLAVGTQALDEPLGSHTQPAEPIGDVLTLRAILGPRDDWFTAATDLAVGDWVVSPRSNRVGLRLDRPAPGEKDSAATESNGAAVQQAPALRRKDSRELPSEGVVLGAVQVPPSGQPVLFLADHPVTGGYPVIAVVLDSDIDLAAQARPGQRLRFRLEPTA
jgi:biotin-dependent carboxylase-like uncharacterized protein